MQIDIASLLENSDVLLVFTVLAFGLLIGRVRIGSFELGNTTGVLLAALVFGYWQFDMHTQTESLGFMLFIFCVGLEAGPNFFSNFLQDGVRYISIAALVALAGVGITVLTLELLDLDAGVGAGMLAGALTSTPTLVGAQDAVNQQLAHLGPDAQEAIIGRISLGYAMTYIVGMVGLLLTIRYAPRLLKLNLREESHKVAVARGMERRRSVRTPILRAYRVTDAGAAEFGGKTLREFGLWERSGLLVERIKRAGELLEPGSETVIQAGDKVALVGYPNAHAASQINLVEEAYDPDLLEFRVDSAQIVVSDPKVVGRTIGELRLESEHGCLIDGVVRAQVELPLDRSLQLNRGDVLSVSGEHNRLKAFAESIGFFDQESDISDLMSFSFFFIGGLMLAQFAVIIGELRLTLGNAGGLLMAGILMGHFRSRNPVFGHIPKGAINMLKDLGLNIFMVSVGLSAGGEIVQALLESGPIILLSGAIIMLAPLVIGYVFGTLVLKMNPALLLGALTGAMTSTPALKSLNEATGSAVPSLGYAGTYTFSNVFLTLGGAAIIML
jgi:putative transport protein